MLDNFPRQKIASSQKTRKWAIDCAKKGIAMTTLEDPQINQSQRNKIINYNLANDILDQRDVEQITNPFKIKGISFPAKLQNYPQALPKIDLLVGEESKRLFNWRAINLNRDAISEKDATKKKELENFLRTLGAQAEEMSDKEMQREIQEKMNYLNYDFQDFREQRATSILKYYWDRQNFQKKFNEGFTDALIAGEENYCIEVEVGEPILRKVNPLNLRAYRRGESPYLQDASLIIEEGYHSPAKVVDAYNDFLTPSEIDQIERGRIKVDDSTAITIRTNGEMDIIPDGVFDMGDGTIIDPSTSGSLSNYKGAFDDYGNVLVTKVTWASFRKVGILTSYDEVTGERVRDIVDEKYEIDETTGEEIEWRWVKEWWETTQIGAESTSIFTKIQRKPSFRASGNPSLCHSGYVGLAYNINSSKAMSLMDRMKPYQYLYNILMYRTELAIAKSHGKIMRLPLHEIPAGWTMDKYLAFAFGYNISVYDAFKEGKKGAAMGKLAGHMNQNSNTIDMEMSSYIQQHIDMMAYIKEELGEISGVSKARQGQIHNRQAVGNVEREVTQSSHITEKWFLAHDLVKKEVMQVFLDIAIHALKDNPIKAQIVMGDFLTETFEAHEDDFSQAEMGIVISNSAKDQELDNILKSLSQELVKNNQITFGDLAKIYTSDSIAATTRKIELAQQQRTEQQQESEQKQNETNERIANQAIEWEKEKHYSALDMEKYKTDSKAYIEEAKLMADNGGDHGDEKRIVTLETLRQNQEKIDNAFYNDNERLKLEKEKLEETKRKNKEEATIKRKAINKKPVGSK